MTFLFYVPQMAEYGGMERHVCLLANLLSSMRHSVVMVTTSNSLNQVDRASLRATGVELREMPVARGRASKARKLAWLTLNVISLRARSWDVICSNGQSSLARISWLAANGKTRIVHHHHTASSPDELKTWHPAFRRAMVASPEIVACSDSTRGNLEKALERRDVVYLPYLTSEICSSSAVKEKSHEPGSKLHFGFVGRLVSTKGIETICRLSGEPMLAGIRWHIHGSGEGYPKSYFDAVPNVRFHGPYSGNSECAAVLQTLDALVLFSRHNEGMPLSIIEAMAVGLPWIATDQGGTRELAIVSENTEIVPAQASFDEIKTSALAFATRIRTGKTSRVIQRRAYDEHFAPEIVANRWMQFLGCPRTA